MISHVAYSSDGNYKALAQENYRSNKPLITIYDKNNVEIYALKSVFCPWGGEINDLLFTADNHYIVYIKGSNLIISKFDKTTKKPSLKAIKENQTQFTSLAVHPHNHFLVPGDNNGTIDLFKLDSEFHVKN